MEQRITDPHPLPEEKALDNTLRPLSFDEYIGQSRAKENLRVFVAAAKQRGEALDHILLCGPPGLGKTTLAHIIARELGVGLRITGGPAIERKGDLVGILTNLEPYQVLFIDEIHRLNAAIEENLYPAMEQYTVDIVYGSGPHANTIRLSLNPFTLIGATTRAGLLTSPLRERFGYTAHLDYYSPQDLVQIVKRSARIMEIAVTDDGALGIARRGRGTPRIVNRLLRRIRDFAQMKGKAALDTEIVDYALDQLGVDDAGLEQMDRLILTTIAEKFSGGPVGIETIAAAIGEERDTIESYYEPFLLKEGFINRTPRGRVLTQRAYDHLGIKPPSGLQGRLL